MKTKEYDYRASQKYQREKCRKICVQMNKRIHADLLAWMDAQPNKAEYLKNLIRADMEAHGFKLPDEQ